MILFAAAMGGSALEYDYLIVGAGLFGATFAHEARQQGQRCLVLERRGHAAGNIYTEEVEGIQVHRYGAHIFHTSDKLVWEYVNHFTEFNNFINAPVAFYKNEIYNLPFNMNTFSRMWGVHTPAEAQAKIARQVQEAGIREPRNLEEQAIRLVGRDIYEKLIKGYTEKQWGRPCTELPPFIIKRLPVRFTYDNNYFSDRYQGIPVRGYTNLVERLLEGTEVRLGTDYLQCRDAWRGKFKKLVFTGPIDGYYDYAEGELEYRSLRFEDQLLPEENHQGCAVVNYTAREVPYTRSIEHKHFAFGTQPVTVVTHEYPAVWHRGDEPYYTVNDERNTRVYKRYAARAARESQIIFGGRLGSYQYYDMDKVIKAALELAEKEFSGAGSK